MLIDSCSAVRRGSDESLQHLSVCEMTIIMIVTLRLQESGELGEMQQVKVDVLLIEGPVVILT